MQTATARPTASPSNPVLQALQADARLAEQIHLIATFLDRSVGQQTDAALARLDHTVGVITDRMQVKQAQALGKVTRCCAALNVLASGLGELLADARPVAPAFESPARPASNEQALAQLDGLDMAAALRQAEPSENGKHPQEVQAFHDSIADVSDEEGALAITAAEWDAAALEMRSAAEANEPPPREFVDWIEAGVGDSFPAQPEPEPDEAPPWEPAPEPEAPTGLAQAAAEAQAGSLDRHAQEQPITCTPTSAKQAEPPPLQERIRQAILANPGKSTRAVGAIVGCGKDAVRAEQKRMAGTLNRCAGRKGGA